MKSVSMATWTLFSFISLTAAFVVPAFEQNATVSDAECFGPNMVFVPETGKCACAVGSYGDPDFFCSKTMNHVCTIKDPQRLRSFDGQDYFYDYPCPQTVAELHMLFNDEEVRMDVFLSSSYDNSSFLVLDGMGVRTGNRSLFFMDGQLRVDGDLVDSNAVPSDWKYHVMPADKNALFLYGQDVLIMMRPYQKDHHKDMPSGIQIAYSTLHGKRVHEVYEQCSHGQGEFEDAMSNMGYRYPEIYALIISIEAYDMLRDEDKDLVPRDLKAMCDDADHSYTSCLVTEKTEMINRCGPVLTNSIIRLCLTYAGQNVMDVFAHCFKGMCAHAESSCDFLQRPDILNCFPEGHWCQQHIDENEHGAPETTP